MRQTIIIVRYNDERLVLEFVFYCRWCASWWYPVSLYPTGYMGATRITRILALGSNQPAYTKRIHASIKTPVPRLVEVNLPNCNSHFKITLGNSGFQTSLHSARIIYHTTYVHVSLLVISQRNVLGQLLNALHRRTSLKTWRRLCNTVGTT